MDVTRLWEELAQDGGTIVYVILDGAGGAPHPGTGKTALQAARTPNLDRLAAESSCGMLEMAGPGITPGSGPGHLALFGYDPLRYRIGRGVLSALGIDFDLREGDVAARANFATVDPSGRIVDRRAGRIPTEKNRELCARIREALSLDFGGHYFFETESGHRAALILRGEGLGGDVSDTDPQATGVPPRAPEAASPESRETARLVREFLCKAAEALSGEERANAILLRGFERYSRLPSLSSRFGLSGLCIAAYPMYRGVSRLLGMDVADPPPDMRGSFEALSARFGDGHDFYFLHVKDADARGEDGDFEGKVAVLEAVDREIPRLFELGADVLVVASDHSTPASMKMHSWHPVPAMIRSRHARAGDVTRFDEYGCMRGALGLRPGVHLLGLAMAHAGRLKKFGA